MTETIDTANLRALAEAATPGPWIYFPKPKYQEHHVSIPLPDSGMRLALFDDGCPTGAPDAQFIAAANPATILALLDRLAAAEARNATLTDDAARLDWLRENSCDLRCIDVPTGAGDGDVHWVVVEHYMAKPHEREIGRAYSDEPREAIDAAIQARAPASISTKGDGHA